MNTHSMQKWKEEQLKTRKISTVATKIFAINKFAEYLGIKYRLKCISVNKNNFVSNILTREQFDKLCSLVANQR